MEAIGVGCCKFSLSESSALHAGKFGHNFNQAIIVNSPASKLFLKLLSIPIGLYKNSV
jgi:hypothetical protein